MAQAHSQWRNLAKAFVLGDGHISQKEVTKLREEMLHDGKISKSEIDFLMEIKQEAKSTVKLFDEFIAECEALVAAQ